jgi:uncharacterized membrane protein
MRRKSLSILAAGVIAILGCESKSPPGGPGASKPGSTPRVGTADNTFSISVAGADLKQGESKTVTVSITRGTNFDQDVKLAIANTPQGVTMKFDDPVLKASVKEVHLTIDASKDAALGEHKITLTATPAREGPATSVDFKIEVKKP